MPGPLLPPGMPLNPNHMSPTSSGSYKACNRETRHVKLAKESADELAVVGSLVEDDDLISFVVSGLNPLFNTFVIVNSFAARDLQMSFADFQSEHLNHEDAASLDNQ